MPIDLNKIKTTMQNGADTVAKKSQELVEMSSIKLQISSSEKKIEELYNKIGEKYYKQYKNEKYNNDDLKKLCKEINELNEDIKYLKNKIEKLKR